MIENMVRRLGKLSQEIGDFAGLHWSISHCSTLAEIMVCDLSAALPVSSVSCHREIKVVLHPEVISLVRTSDKPVQDGVRTVHTLGLQGGPSRLRLVSPRACARFQSN